MNGIIYKYRDNAGLWHRFKDPDKAYRYYRAFLKMKGLRLQDLKAYANENKYFSPLAAYDERTGRFYGWLEMYC